MKLNEMDVLKEIDPVRLGRALRKARKAKGILQAEAALLIGKSRPTLSAIEAGERRIRPGELIALARAYDRTINSFVRPRPDIEDFEALRRQAIRAARFGSWRLARRGR